MIIPGTLEGEEYLLYQRVSELAERAEKRYQPQFSYFLNPREQKIAFAAARQKGNLFGGFSGALRQMIGFPPPYETLLPEDFPIQGIKMIHEKRSPLEHRDVLGSLMNLGIVRGGLGDILPEEDFCTVLCTIPVAEVLLQDLKRIGRRGVSVEKTTTENLASTQEFQEIEGTIASPRLDSLVSLFARTSRGKAELLIQSGRVQQNYQIQQRSAAPIAEKDVITIQGTGKFLVDSFGNPTRKGRIPVSGRRYQ